MIGRWICCMVLGLSAIWSVGFDLVKVFDGLERPWSITFLSEDRLFITEKSGRFCVLDLESLSFIRIPHNLAVLDRRQGGLLDSVYQDGDVWVSYAEDRGKGFSSTSVARARFDDKRLVFLPIFQAEPPIRSGVHFGSRLLIVKDHLYVTVGERGKGDIAQDPMQHPGSIVRLHLDGSVPTDNPHFNDREGWLPDIFQIGVRNPQGMAYSARDDQVLISNHGARGGDWLGRVEKGGNYGWNVLGWGGRHYSGLPIGPKWKPGYTRPIVYWVPSIAVSAIVVYDGAMFPEWNGHVLVTSLKDQSLRLIRYEADELIEERVLFRHKMGRIRDIAVQPSSGVVYLLSDSGSVWRLSR